jgi:tryptophan synthase beta chain
MTDVPSAVMLARVGSTAPSCHSTIARRNDYRRVDGERDRAASRMTDHGHQQSYPDAAGNYGRFGGVHYPPELQPALRELARAYEAMRSTPELDAELGYARRHFQGRPTPVHFLRNLTDAVEGAALFIKREDLNHTGAHKLNHCIGFAVLAKKLGKTKLIAETGAGQHGVALATAAAYFDLQCEVHMGEVDVAKAHSNVSRMRILGAEVVPVAAGQGALKDASDSAYAAYAKQHRSALYAIGSAIGPHPFPLMVRDFQSVVGQEAREQFAEMADGALPDHVVACVAGGSNAMGIFTAFLDDAAIALHCVEPLGTSSQLGEHAATLTFGSEGTIHGARCLVLQDADGAPANVASIASGLVYPGVGPEISMLVDSGRASAHTIDDEQALDAFFRLSRTEGIIPALESAHAIAYAVQLAARRPTTERILVNLSGRGDKDVDYVIANHGPPR